MSLFSSLQVSASGMSAQRLRAELLVENMANAETTRTAEGGPYRRKDVVFSPDVQASPFSAVFQHELGQGVRVADIEVAVVEEQDLLDLGRRDPSARTLVALDLSELESHALSLR